MSVCTLANDDLCLFEEFLLVFVIDDLPNFIPLDLFNFDVC